MAITDSLYDGGLHKRMEHILKSSKLFNKANKISKRKVCSGLDKLVLISNITNTFKENKLISDKFAEDYRNS